MHNLEIDVGENYWRKCKEVSIYLVKKSNIDLKPFNFYVFYDEKEHNETIKNFKNKLFDKLFDFIEGERK